MDAPDRVLLWSDERDRAAIVPLRAAVARMGLPLDDFTPGSTRGLANDVLVVCVSRAMLEAPERLDEQASSWKGRLLPVALDAEAIAHVEAGIGRLARLKWILGREEAAQRLGVAVLTKPEWWRAWNELQLRAERYAAGHTAELLSGGEVGEADRTIARRPRELLPEVPALVRGLVEASRHRGRRRFALAATVVAVTGTLLGGATVVALVQRSEARMAEAEARSSERRATAGRFSRTAERYLNADPDIPVLLAREAYALDPSQANRHTLLAAIDHVPPHRSLRLVRTPARLAVARTGTILVSASDGSIELLNVHSPKRIGRIPREPGASAPAVAALSPDGRWLAVARRSGFVELRSTARPGHVMRVVRTGRATRRPIDMIWTESAGVVTAWSGGGLTMHPPTRRTGRQVAVPGLASIDALAANRAGRMLAILDRDRVVLLSGAGLRRCGTLSLPSEPGDIGLSDEGGWLLVASLDGVSRSVRVPRGCRSSSNPAAQPAIWPGASPATALAAIRDGAALGTPLGQVVVQHPDAPYPARRFRAHSGRIAAMALAAGRLVTVGVDRWLRIWRLPEPLVGYPTGGAADPGLSDAYVLDNQRWGRRSRVDLDVHGKRLLVAVYARGEVAQADADAPNAGTHQMFFGEASAATWATSHGCRVLVLPLGGGARLFDCTGARPREVWTLTSEDTHPQVVAGAVSPNGRYVAVSDGDVVRVVDTATEIGHTAVIRGVAGMTFRGDGGLVLVDSSGEVVILKSDGVVRRTRLALGGDSVRSAATDPAGRRAVVVTSAGEVLCIDLAADRVLARPRLGVDLKTTLSVQLSPDGRLAGLVSRRGVIAFDVDSGAHVRVDQTAEEIELGAQPRDLVFDPRSSRAFIVRADGGVATMQLERWRALRGRALLDATAFAVPRAAGAGELENVVEASS
jgi:hypothetical protein